MKKLKLLILILLLANVCYAISPITGPVTLCGHTYSVQSDATTGGTWTSSNPSVILIEGVSGTLCNIAAGIAGTATVTYTVGSSYVTNTITVLASFGTISGPSSICVGSSVTFTEDSTGGTWIGGWSSAVAVTGSTGVVTGVSTGSAIITYYGGTIGCPAIDTITVIAAPAAIGGPSSVCLGSTITLTDAVSGGTWLSTTTSVATVGFASGIVTGLALGTTTVSYTVGTGCSVSKVITVGPLPVSYTVSGGGAYCVGGPGEMIVLGGSDIGVTYELMLGTSVVGTMSGTGGVISFGPETAGGTYVIVASGSSGCSRTMTGSASITVNPLPVIHNVTGGGAFCSGSSGVHIGLDGSETGVNYQLVLGGSGLGTTAGTGAALDLGLSATPGVYYVEATNATTGCTSTMNDSAMVSVSATVTPGVTITASPGTTVCAGTAVTFTAVPVNGGASPTYVWTVNGITMGVGSSYTYVPTSGDIVGVTLTSDALCAVPLTASSSVTMTVIAVPVVTASYTSSGCGGAITLTASGASTYFWEPSSVSCTSCATTYDSINSTTTYAVIGTNGGMCSDTAFLTVAINRIYGDVSFDSTTPDTLDMKVWLIQFNSSDSSLIATDSTTTCISGGLPHYEFNGAPSGNYMVKGMLLYGNPPGSSGYIPTYGASSAHWYSASNIAHGSGSDNMNINMIYGTVPSGPGFIGGLISSGAGRGTSILPAVGMLVYLMDAGTHTVLTHAITDGTGAYSFRNLANGNYIVYPENFDDYTTASATINITTAAETINGINFMQHTTSRTITPVSTNKVNTTPNAESLNVYPNPTTGVLNIVWTNQVMGSANVVIADVLGRVVNNSVLNMNSTSGQVNMNLSSLTDGIYLLTIKSDNVYYTSKLQIQK